MSFRFSALRLAGLALARGVQLCDGVAVIDTEVRVVAEAESHILATSCGCAGCTAGRKAGAAPTAPSAKVN